MNITYIKSSALLLLSMTVCMNTFTANISGKCWSIVRRCVHNVSNTLSPVRTSVRFAAKGTKGLLSGTSFVGKKAFPIVRSIFRPNAFKWKIRFAGLGLAYGAFRTVLTRIKLYNSAYKTGFLSVPKKYKALLWLLEPQLSGVMGRKTRIYDWRLKKPYFSLLKNHYPTASSIKYPAGYSRKDRGAVDAHRRNVVKALFNDLDNFYSENTENNTQENRRERLNRIIDEGLDELDGMLKKLSSHLYFPSKRFDCLGMNVVLMDACREYVRQHQRIEMGDNVDERAREFYALFCTNDLTAEQEADLDVRVKARIKTTWSHVLTGRPNFGLAASLYWEVLKRYKRLQAIKSICAIK